MTEKRMWGVARGRIKQHLTDNPDGATVDDLVAACGLGKTTVYFELRRFKKCRLAYIDRWLPVPGGRFGGMYVAVWCWGRDEDAPRPAAPRTHRQSGQASCSFSASVACPSARLPISSRAVEHSPNTVARVAAR